MEDVDKKRIDINWNINAIPLEFESLLYHQLEIESAIQLSSRLLNLDLPNHDGLCFYQATNILRQILRDKIGHDVFNSFSEFGTEEGRRNVANLFEIATEKFLRDNNVRFKTEQMIKDELKDIKANYPKVIPSDTRRWKFKGYDRLNRQIFEGKCCNCKNVICVPFKPKVGYPSPACGSCRNINFLTPDFLILDDLYINNHKVHWIDCKCYYLCASNGGLQFEKSIIQFQKYKNKWGSGALLFAFGFCDNAKSYIPDEDILLLDAENELDLEGLHASILKYMQVSDKVVVDNLIEKLSTLKDISNSRDNSYQQVHEESDD